MTDQPKRWGRPKGSGPPPVYTTRIEALVSPRQRTRLEAEAARRGITVAAVIRALIDTLEDQQ